jgi:hypothetical protein
LGVERLLSEHRPLIYVEVGPEQRQEMTRILKGYGYRFYNGDSTDNAERDECSFNTLAVPGESTMTNVGLEPTAGK